MALLRRRRPADGSPRRRRPSANLLRRERNALLGAREQRVSDLGGLAAEMYRYGAWRSDLLQERCAEIAGIDARIDEIDALLGHAPVRMRCLCGAELPAGARRCLACGRVQGT